MKNFESKLQILKALLDKMLNLKAEIDLKFREKMKLEDSER